jgi:hypothetical protein
VRRSSGLPIPNISFSSGTAVYSHVRRKALNEAAQALEPDALPTHTPNGPEERVEGVTSHVTSQSGPARSKVLDFPRKFGSSGWTRTSNPPVNSLSEGFFIQSYGVINSCIVNDLSDVMRVA